MKRRITEFDTNIDPNDTKSKNAASKSQFSGIAPTQTPQYDAAIAEKVHHKYANPLMSLGFCVRRTKTTAPAATNPDMPVTSSKPNCKSATLPNPSSPR